MVLCEETVFVLSAFPTFVPSLSCENNRFRIEKRLILKRQSEKNWTKRDRCLTWVTSSHPASRARSLAAHRSWGLCAAAFRSSPAPSAQQTKKR